MGKHLELFNSQSEYDSFILSDEFVEPNVSYIVENEAVNFHPYVIDYKSEYLTFEAIEDSTFKLTQNACNYSLDEGETWVSLSKNTTTPTVPAGSKIMFKATNPTISGSYGMGTFSSTGKFNVEGNIMSLLYGDDFVGKTDLTGKDCAFYRLFSGCTNVVEARNLILPATTLVKECYRDMFTNCKSLITAPELPTSTLASTCYAYMFKNCTSLTEAPELPETTLASSCYLGMFSGCTSLVTAPELPATTLASSCYSNMFNGCSSLTSAPELPATTLASSCYNSMLYGTNVLPDYSNIDFTNEEVAVSGALKGLFAGTKVTDADLERILPKNNEGKYYLPATTLSDYCYSNMFEGCTGLFTAPELPATTLASNCYVNMFSGCTSLVTAPELPATTLAEYCYEKMFYGCTSLTTAPELPATTLNLRCYEYMFTGCKGLTTAPELPATTLAGYCYYAMFSGCTSLVTATELPATTLSNYCYSEMFSGCKGLTTAPELPATTLKNYCYQYMFWNCSKLNYIKMLATDISAKYCLNEWVYNVAGTGTFTKHPDMSSLPSGVSGIPKGWTVENA